MGKKMPPPDQQGMIDICKEAASFPEEILDEMDADIDKARVDVTADSQEELMIFRRSNLLHHFRQFRDAVRGAIKNDVPNIKKTRKQKMRITRGRA